MELSYKEIIFLRWVSVTIGGEMPVENNEIRTAVKLQKKKLINIGYTMNHAMIASLTKLGEDSLNTKN
jgi:hypothetical protein